MPRTAAKQVAEAMRAQAQRECATLLRELGGPGDFHGAVHEARKAVRRLRALLALVEDELAGAQVADRALARVGKSLSALRDAQVLVATAQAMAARDGAKGWSPVIARLTLRRDALVAKVLASDPGLRRRGAAVERIARRLDALPWAELKPAHIRHGLRRSLRRVAKAEKKAKADPAVEHLHRWRRRVRRLRMQLEAVADVAPGLAKQAGPLPGGETLKTLHALGDRLGAQQDERLLRNVLRRMRDLPGRAQLADALCRGATPERPRRR